MTFEVPIEWCGRYWRENHDHERVLGLAHAMIVGDEPPPIVVTVHERNGQPFYGVSDGYHRLHAAFLIGRETLRAVTLEEFDSVHAETARPA